MVRLHKLWFLEIAQQQTGLWGLRLGSCLLALVTCHLFTFLEAPKEFGEDPGFLWPHSQSWVELEQFRK